jgi:hypothetical protein
MIGLRKKTFEGITAGLSKLVSELRDFAGEQQAESDRKSADVLRLCNEVEGHDTERDRANSTAAKIEGLLA